MAMRGKRRRPPEDAFALRFPGLATRVNSTLTAAVTRLPPSWRLRQWALDYAAVRAFSAISRGDLDVLRTINHPEVVYDLSRWGWPEASTYLGLDGMVRFQEEWLEQWSEPQLDVTRVEELEERVVFLIHVDVQGVGRVSGLESQMNLFQLVRLRDGLVWRNIFFRDRAEAIAAVRSGEAWSGT
jgi:hypothetical protein